MAVDEVNEKLLAPMGHSLDFVVAETYGQEEVSIRQVRIYKIILLLYKKNIFINTNGFTFIICMFRLKLKMAVRRY